MVNTENDWAKADKLWEDILGLYSNGYEREGGKFGFKVLLSNRENFEFKGFRARYDDPYGRILTSGKIFHRVDGKIIEVGSFKWINKNGPQD